MNLDDLKNKWQQKDAPKQLESSQRESLYQRYKLVNQKMIRTNIFTSIGMLLTMVFIAWIWWMYQANQGWAFDGSILSVEILIVLVSGVFWSRVTHERNIHLNDDTKSFLQSALKKLRWTINITKKVMPIYAVLLNISLVLYFYDLMKHKPSWFLIATIVTTAYILGMSFIGFKRHRKKQKQEIEPLIKEMEETLQAL